MPDQNIRIPPELEDVVNQIGEFIQYWGFKNVHGRIWVHLFLTSEPLTASDLIERLKISKALVSMSINDLIDYDVIQTVGKSSRGSTLYRANPDVISVIENVLRKRERRMLSRISAATRLLKKLPDSMIKQNLLQIERIHSLSDMVETAEQSLDGILELGAVDFKTWQPFEICPTSHPTSHPTALPSTTGEE